MERVVIIPRPRGDGWSLLTASGLALWHLDDIEALNYGRWWCRERGGMVWILDSHGAPIVSEIVEPGSHSAMAQVAGGRRDETAG